MSRHSNGIGRILAMSLKRGISVGELFQPKESTNIPVPHTLQQESSDWEWVAHPYVPNLKGEREEEGERGREREVVVVVGVSTGGVIEVWYSQQNWHTWYLPMLAPSRAVVGLTSLIHFLYSGWQMSIFPSLSFCIVALQSLNKCSLLRCQYLLHRQFGCKDVVWYSLLTRGSLSFCITMFSRKWEMIGSVSGKLEKKIKTL